MVVWNLHDMLNGQEVLKLSCLTYTAKLRQVVGTLRANQTSMGKLLLLWNLDLPETWRVLQSFGPALSPPAGACWK